jgi:hypothetical protein
VGLEYRTMRGFLIFKACRFARGMSVVMAILLLCLGVFFPLLSLSVSGSEGPSASGMTNVLHVDQAANGNDPLLDGNYLFARTNEAEETDISPVNAVLLTMLFLAASFFGVSTGWLLSNAQGQGASCSSLGVVGEVLGSTCEDYLPFLGVFRL